MPSERIDPLNDSPNPYRDTLHAINELQHTTQHLLETIIHALTALQHEANQHDSHPTTASGRATDTGGNNDDTRVETATLNRLGTPTQPGPTTQAWQLYDYAICARDATRHLTRQAQTILNRTAINHHQLTDTERRTRTCIYANCHDLAEHDGMCERHTIEQRAIQRAKWANERRRRRHRQ